MMLFETTADPSLRRIYAAIDYAACQALVEIAESAMDAYAEIWGRCADERSAYLQSWERCRLAQETLEALFEGLRRHRTSWRFDDDGAEYCCEVTELPLDGLFVALRCAGGARDGNREALAYFDTLTKAIAFVDRFPVVDPATPPQLQVAFG